MLRYGPQAGVNLGSNDLGSFEVLYISFVHADNLRETNVYGNIELNLIVSDHRASIFFALCFGPNA